MLGRLGLYNIVCAVYMLRRRNGCVMAQEPEILAATKPLNANYIFIYTHNVRTLCIPPTHKSTHSAFTCSQPIYIVCPIVQIRIILRSIYECECDYEYIGHAWRVYIYYIIAVLGDGENALVRLFFFFFCRNEAKNPNGQIALIRSFSFALSFALFGL